jgi:hypothetical protein
VLRLTELVQDNPNEDLVYEYSWFMINIPWLFSSEQCIQVGAFCLTTLAGLYKQFALCDDHILPAIDNFLQQSPELLAQLLATNFFLRPVPDSLSDLEPLLCLHSKLVQQGQF